MLLKGASPLGKETPPQKAGKDNTESHIPQEGQNCYVYFQEGWRNEQRDFYVDGCFVSVNHLFEESLDGVNESMKTTSLPWLSEGLQRSSHMEGDSPQGVCWLVSDGEKAQGCC